MFEPVLVTNWATAALSVPVILSPITELTSKDKPETVVNLSNVGADVSFDSRTETTLATSQTFKEISLSSTL